MIPVRKSMRLIPDSLEDLQCTRIIRQLQRERAAGAIYLLEFFGQANDWDILKAETLKLLAGRTQLAFPAIHDDQIGQPDQPFGRSTLESRHRLVDGLLAKLG